MSTIDKIRQLRLTDPILEAAYKAHQDDEDEAVRAALLAHVYREKEMSAQLVRMMKAAPTGFRLDLDKMTEEEKGQLFSKISFMMSQEQRELLMRKLSKDGGH